jgi:ABC-type uncharacterized transport system substrate-binding protein
VSFSAHAYTGVTIVLSASTKPNYEFVDQFKAELDSTKNHSLRVKVINLQEVEKLVVAENSELIIALGERALKASSKLNHTTPVIGLFTSLTTFNSLLKRSRRDLSNFSAIELDQPYMRQMSLIKTILPSANIIGILLGTTSSLYGEVLKEASEKSGLNIQEEKIYQESELIPKLKVMLESTDALMAIPDPIIYNRETTQSILLTGYRYQKPVFGYSQSFVRAGALATVFSSSQQLAKQAAEIAIKSQLAPSLLPPPQPPKYFSVMVNYQVARSLHIPLTDEDTIHRKILGAETKENEDAQY